MRLRTSYEAHSERGLIMPNTHAHTPVVSIVIAKDGTENTFTVPAKFGTTVQEILRDKELSAYVNDGLYRGYAVTFKQEVTK